MTSRWNARADSASTIIMWLITLTATIICGYWLISNIRPYHTQVKDLDNELEVLQERISTACDMEAFNWTYNPKLERGNIIIRGNQVCVNSDSCIVYYYQGNMTPEIRDGVLWINSTSYCPIPQKCKGFYYSTDEEPSASGNLTFINNTESCREDKPILRCLPIVCDIGASYDVNLKDLVNITVISENGTFSFRKSRI